MTGVVRNVLITGATGAIGPTVVRTLQREGFQLRVLARYPQPASAHVDVVVGDLVDRRALEAAVAGVDAVVHLAAVLHRPILSDTVVSAARAVNAEATRDLAAIAAARGIRLVFTSSIAVYGVTGAAALHEERVASPTSLYGETKLEAERAVIAAHDAEGRPIGVVLRLAAVYGPGLKGNYRRLVRALARHRFVGIGAGANHRALVHVDDVAQAIVLALRSSPASSRLYNVSDGGSYTVGTIISTICRALGRRPPRVTVPLGAAGAAVRMLDALGAVVGRRAVFGPALAKYTEDVVVDSSRIQRELGFRPQIALDRG